ncbi:MAG: alpha-E domain-containing protein [Pseudomonadales bacterium]
MLSSVAERLYWMARYLERVEDTARLTYAYTQFILDTPRGSEPGWRSLIDIIDGHVNFERRYKNYNERNVCKFLIADMDNMSSIRYSVRAARENVRTTRDVLPEECWELVNELYIYVTSNAEKVKARQSRLDFLDYVLALSAQINGVIGSSLSHDHAYRFMRMGRNLERADMTSRVVDVAVMTEMDGNLGEEASTWIWGHLLKSLSAVTAYRRKVGPLVDANDVVNFVFNDPNFPRSISYCLSVVRKDSRALRNHTQVEKLLLSMSRKLGRFDASKMSAQKLHRYIDVFQEQLIKLNLLVYQSWFSR